MSDVCLRCYERECADVGTTPTPLSQLRHTVLGLTHGAPVLSSSLDPDATWYPGTWLTDPDSPSLHELVKIIADEWGGSPHVAAALAFKGYAWAAALPVVAGWQQHGCVPMLDSASLRVGVARRLPFVRLDLTATPIAAPSDSAALLEAARTSLLDGHLREVIEALAEATRISQRLLWGSVAEAVVNVAMQLDGADGARRALTLLGSPIAGLVESCDAYGVASIRRRTCCLWFATDAGRAEYCATCPVVC